MRAFLCLLALLILTFSAGCGIQSANNNQGGQVLYRAADATGTVLAFYEKPQRIVSLNVSVDEILLDLVDSRRLAALSFMADDSSICNAGEKAKLVKERASSTDVERIMALQPDLVFVPDYDMNVARSLRSSGLKVYVCRMPSDMQGILSFIEEIGTAVGEPAAGEEMSAALKRRLEKIRGRVEAAVPPSERLSVLCLSFTGPIGSKGTFDDLCYYAGVRNALAGIDIPYQGNLSEEKMLELNPDMIITPSWDYSKQGNPEKFRQKILDNPLYKNLKAVQNQKVVRVHDQYLYSTSQYTALAAEELAMKAYPQLFLQ